MDKIYSWTVEKKVNFAVENSMAVHSQMFSPNVFLIYALTIPEVVNFFLEGVGEGGGREIHCLGLYQNDLYRNKLISQWLVSQSLSIKLSSGIVAASDVYPKKIYKKQANWLNDKTMVLNSICELSWLFSVSHHRKLVWSYRSVICLCVRHQLLVFFRWVLKTVKIKKSL